MIYDTDIRKFTEFGFITESRCYPYNERTNQIIRESIVRDQTRVMSHYFGPLHQEVQEIDLQTYIIEKSMILQYDQTETFYGLLGKRGDDWVRLVPDLEYTEMVIEYIDTKRDDPNVNYTEIIIKKHVHYARVEGDRIMTKDGVLVGFPKNIQTHIDIHDTHMILKNAQLSRSNRKFIIRHVPYGVQYYYSPMDQNIMIVRKEDIIHSEKGSKSASTEQCGSYLIDSRGEHVMLSSIQLFEVFSPEERKRQNFEKIREELIEKTHEPCRVFNWCYDEEDRSRISSAFII